jgi:geranylgeranyl diphosphate synthase, type II
MDQVTRIERALAVALEDAVSASCPPRLVAAARHAVFPGGARIRPRLCLTVAAACGEDNPGLVDAAAATIELMHCASLVHDDLPCFDDAPTRRGKPSVHRAFGERLAVLSGDALIVVAFQTLARKVLHAPDRAGALLLMVARSVGMPSGIVAGQAWECESHVALAEYQRAKTGALFAAATMAGAIASGADPGPWRDIDDAAGDPEQLGKPTGRDLALGRPSAATQFGVAGAIQRLEHLVASALASIPPCSGAAALREAILNEARGLVPTEIMRRAA